MTLDEGRIMTWRLPAFSALLMLLRASCRTEVRTILAVGWGWRFSDRLRGNEVSASVPKRVTLAFRGSVSVESALVDDGCHEGSACSVADGESVSGGQPQPGPRLRSSHDFSPRPSRRASSCRRVISERIVTYLDGACVEELGMVDRGRGCRTTEQIEKIRRTPSCGGPCTRKLALMLGGGRVGLSQRGLARRAPPAATHNPGIVVPADWVGRMPAHINLSLSRPGPDPLQHSKKRISPLLFEDRIRQLTHTQTRQDGEDPPTPSLNCYSQRPTSSPSPIRIYNPPPRRPPSLSRIQNTPR